MGYRWPVYHDPQPQHVRQGVKARGRQAGLAGHEAAHCRLVDKLIDNLILRLPLGLAGGFAGGGASASPSESCPWRRAIVRIVRPCG